MTTKIYDMTDTWNDAGTDFFGIKMVITDTLYDTASYMMDISSTVAAGYVRADVDGNLDISGSLNMGGDFALVGDAPTVFVELTNESSTGIGAYSLINDLGRRASIGIAGSANPNVDPDSVVFYSQGYGETNFTINGNHPFKWNTEVGDTHVPAAVAQVMELTAAGDLLLNGSQFLEERSAAAADVATYGQIWVSDTSPQELFFTDEDGSDHPISGAVTFKSYSMRTETTGNGDYYEAGFYEYSVTEAALTQASLTVTVGFANNSDPAHAAIVSAGDGATDGSDLVLTVTGTSITDAGVRTPADSEVVVADATAGACPADTYLETTKKWLGTVTFTLSSTAGGTFAFSFNYMLAKYEDFGNRVFTLTDYEVVGLAQANDSGFNAQLYHHNSAGWTHSAGAFTGNNAALLDMNVDHNTEINLVDGSYFNYKRAALTTVVNGAGSEGLISKITTGTNNSILYSDTHIGVVLG